MYITTEDKRYIENYCNVQIKSEDLIRVKALACLLENEYALYEIMQYIKQELDISQEKIYRGECDYILVLERGHVRFSKVDLYFPNCYLHQYVVCKELDMDMEEVRKYVVHHLDENKQNNDISNLWIFFNPNCHIAYHKALERGENVDIMKFTLNYIESILDEDNREDIKRYLQKLYKAEKLKKDIKKCFSIGVLKHLGVDSCKSYRLCN